MNLVDQMTDIIMKTWETKTLADFRKKALLETNGIVFESLRAENGPRFLLVICVTSPEQVAKLEQTLVIATDTPPVDWSCATVGELLVRTAKGTGLSYEDLHDHEGKRTSIVLCATAPKSIAILEKIFNLPK